jgi:hypothetical protein
VEVAGLGLPLTVTVTSVRFRPEIESNVYFVVAEALTSLRVESPPGGGTRLTAEVQPER